MKKFSHSLIQSFELVMRYYPIRAHTTHQPAHQPTHTTTNTTTTTHTTNTNKTTHTHTHRHNQDHQQTHQHNTTTTQHHEHYSDLQDRPILFLYPRDQLKNAAVREEPKVNNSLEIPLLVTDSRKPNTKRQTRERTKAKQERNTNKGNNEHSRSSKARATIGSSPPVPINNRVCSSPSVRCKCQKRKQLSHLHETQVTDMQLPTLLPKENRVGEVRNAAIRHL